MHELINFLDMPITSPLIGGSFVAAALGIGFAIGMLTGVFGVGGGFLLTPALNKFIGLPYDLAAATSLCFAVGTGAHGASLKARSGEIDFTVLMTTAVPAIIGSILGDILQNFLKTSVSADTAAFEALMNTIFIIFLLFIALILLADAFRKNRPALSPLQRLRLGPNITLTRCDLNEVSLLGLIVCGVAVGLLSGLLGVGGGVIFMPLLIMAVGMNVRTAAGTSTGVILITSIAGVIKKSLYTEPKINLSLVMLLLAGSFIGVRIGALLAQRCAGQTLKVLLAGITAIAALFIGTTI